MDTISLNRRALFSALWAGLGRLGRACAQVVFLLVLAREIGPEGFGVASIALIGYQLVSTIASQSFSMALVRYNDENHGRDAAAFWLNIALSFSIAGLICGVAPLAARFLNLPTLAWLLPVATAMALLATPTVIAQARLSKRMEFHKVAAIETIASIVSAMAGVLAAWLGAGLWALVVYAGLQRLAELVGYGFMETIWPRVAPNWPDAPALLRFTMPLAGVQGLAFANGTIDQVFVGRASDPAALGLYGFARRITQQPTQMITFAIERAVFPALVRAREEQSGPAKLLLQAVRISVLTASLPLLFLSVIASDVVVLLLGPEWITAGRYVALFAASSAVLPVGGVLGAALRAEGRTGMQLLFQAIRFTLAFVVLSTMSAIGAQTWSMAIAVAILTMASLMLPAFETSRTFAVPMRRLGVAALSGLWPALLLYGIIQISNIVLFSDISAPLRLAVNFGFGLTFGLGVGILFLRSRRAASRTNSTNA